MEVLGGAWGAFWGPRGGLGGAYGAIGGLMKTLKNHRCLLCFQHLEVLGGLLRTLFSVFFDFRSYLRPYFRFPIVFSVCQIVFAFVFRFLIVFSVSSTDAFSMSVFTGAIRLHERIHGRDSAPRGSQTSGPPRKSAASRIRSELKCYLKGNTRY